MTDTSTNQMRKAASEAEAEAAGSAGTTDAIGESLSALMDSEASEMEVHRLLKLTETDPEVRARWKRYQMVRSVLKGDLEVDPQTDLSARISAAISQEEPLQTHGRLKRLSHGAGKVAIAASVAFAFIVGVQQLGPMGASPSAEVADVPESAAENPASGETAPRNSVPTGFELPPFAARTVSTGNSARESAPQLFNSYPQGLSNQQLQNNRAIQQHFDQLLIKHAERASTNGNMGLLPFARIPSLEGAEE